MLRISRVEEFVDDILEENFVFRLDNLELVDEIARIKDLSNTIVNEKSTKYMTRFRDFSFVYRVLIRGRELFRQKFKSSPR